MHLFPRAAIQCSNYTGLVNAESRLFWYANENISKRYWVSARLLCDYREKRSQSGRFSIEPLLPEKYIGDNKRSARSRSCWWRTPPRRLAAVLFLLEWTPLFCWIQENRRRSWGTVQPCFPFLSIVYSILSIHISLLPLFVNVCTNIVLKTL